MLGSRSTAVSVGSLDRWTTLVFCCSLSLSFTHTSGSLTQWRIHLYLLDLSSHLHLFLLKWHTDVFSVISGKLYFSQYQILSMGAQCKIRKWSWSWVANHIIFKSSSLMILLSVSRCRDAHYFFFKPGNHVSIRKWCLILTKRNLPWCLPHCPLLQLPA